MPRGSKAKYSSKQRRMAHKIKRSYQSRGTSAKSAKARAWATVNKRTGGARKSAAGARRGPTASRRRKGRAAPPPHEENSARREDRPAFNAPRPGPEYAAISPLAVLLGRVSHELP